MTTKTASRVSSSRTASTLVETVRNPNLRWALTPESDVVVATETSSTCGVLPQVRQQHRGRVVARADEAEPDRARRGRAAAGPARPRGGDRCWSGACGRRARPRSRTRAGTRRRRASRPRARRRPSGPPRRGGPPTPGRRRRPTRRPAGRGSSRGCAAPSSGRSRPGSRCPRARSGRRSAPGRTTGRSGRRAPCRSRRSTAGRAWSCRCPRRGPGPGPAAPPSRRAGWSRRRRRGARGRRPGRQCAP